MDAQLAAMSNMRVTRAYKRGQKNQPENGNNFTGNGRGKRTRSAAPPAPMMQVPQPPLMQPPQPPMMQGPQSSMMQAAPAPPYHAPPTSHGHAAAYGRQEFYGYRSNNAQRMMQQPQHQRPQLSAHYQGVLSPHTNHAERHNSRYFTRAQGNERVNPYVRPDQNMAQSTSNQRLYPNMVSRTTTTTYSVPEQLPQLAKDTEQPVVPRYNTRSAVHNLPLATAPTMERYWATNTSRAAVTAQVDAARAAASAHVEASRTSGTTLVDAARVSAHVEEARASACAHMEASHIDAVTATATARKTNKPATPPRPKPVDCEIQTDFTLDDDEVKLIVLIRTKGIPANKINVILEKEDFVVSVVEKSDYRPATNISDEKYDEIVKQSEDLKIRMSLYARWHQYMLASASGLAQALPAIEYPWPTSQPRSNSSSSESSGTRRPSTPALPTCPLQQLQDEAPAQLQVRTRSMTREANKEKDNAAMNVNDATAATAEDDGKTQENTSQDAGPTFPIPTIFNHNFNPMNRFMQHANRFPLGHPFNQPMGPNHLRVLQNLVSQAMFDPRFRLPPGMNPYAAMQGWH